MARQWTDADIANLKKAIASGVLTVSYDGPPKRTITYQSLSEMRGLLSEMVREQQIEAGTASSYRLVATRKGL